MSKFDTPEWRKSPIRAQIREALREIEHVKSAWKALERMADAIESYHQAALEQKRLWRQGLRGEGKDAIDNIARVGINGARATSVAKAGLRLADVELKQLDGWMLSLCESEIGLRAMMTPGFFAAHLFVNDRSRRLSGSAALWEMNRMGLKV